MFKTGARDASATCREIRARHSLLTAREREVLSLVVKGLRSRSIADRLSIRVKTVEVYRSRINRKMGVHNAAELVRLMQSIES